jgi:hypothetical protein
MSGDFIVKYDRQGKIDIARLDQQDLPLPRTLIALSYLVLFAEFSLPFYSDNTVAWLGQEDGLVENTGALCFLLASAIFCVTAYRLSKSHRQFGTNPWESPLALLGLGALCFICFGEEISWGQRLFDYSVPAWLENINRQGEWNLHNLAWFHGQTAGGVEKSFWARLIVMDRLLAIFQLALCTLVPILAAYSRILRTWAACIGLPIVPWWIAGLVPAHILITQAAYTIVGENQIVGDTLDETKESLRAFIFLMVAVWAYRQTTPISSVVAGDQQSDSDRSLEESLQR